MAPRNSSGFGAGAVGCSVLGVGECWCCRCVVVMVVVVVAVVGVLAVVSARWWLLLVVCVGVGVDCGGGGGGGGGSVVDEGSSVGEVWLMFWCCRCFLVGGGIGVLVRVGARDCL